MNNSWVFSEYFQVCRDYISQLLTLTILLITGCTIAFYNAKKTNSKILFLTGFIMGILSLIVGLLAYGQLTEIVLNLTSHPEKTDVTAIKYFIYTQVGIDSIALLIFSYAAIKEFWYDVNKKK